MLNVNWPIKKGKSLLFYNQQLLIRFIELLSII